MCTAASVDRWHARGGPSKSNSSVGVAFTSCHGPVASSRSHTFGQLALAINSAFARWDLAHLYQFTRANGDVLGQPELDDVDDLIDAELAKLDVLACGEQFAFEFDFGDGWTHLCTVGNDMIDPSAELGVTPRGPLAYFGWGAMPDQYGRTQADDDSDTVASDPGLGDLRPLIDW